MRAQLASLEDPSVTTLKAAERIVVNTVFPALVTKLKDALPTKFKHVSTTKFKCDIGFEDMITLLEEMLQTDNGDSPEAKFLKDLKDPDWPLLTIQDVVNHCRKHYQDSIPIKLAILAVIYGKAPIEAKISGLTNANTSEEQAKQKVVDELYEKSTVSIPSVVIKKAVPPRSASQSRQHITTGNTVDVLSEKISKGEYEVKDLDHIKRVLLRFILLTKILTEDHIAYRTGYLQKIRAVTSASELLLLATLTESDLEVELVDKAATASITSAGGFFRALKGIILTCISIDETTVDTSTLMRLGQNQIRDLYRALRMHVQESLPAVDSLEISPP